MSAYYNEIAGWPDTRSVWSGSSPCQPFSCAGKQLGTADKRHLWPAWFRLIRECRPANARGGIREARAVSTTVITGDCLEVLAKLEPDSID